VQDPLSCNWWMRYSIWDFNYPILVVQKPESPVCRGVWGRRLWFDDFFLRLADGKAGSSSSAATLGAGLGTEPARVSLVGPPEDGGWKRHFSYRVWRGFTRHSQFTRIPAGAKRLDGKICCDGRTLSFVTSSRRKLYLAHQLPFWDVIVETRLGA
jgi:hypothetical protein